MLMYRRNQLTYLRKVLLPKLESAWVYTQSYLPADYLPFDTTVASPGCTSPGGSVLRCRIDVRSTCWMDMPTVWRGITLY